MPYPCCEVFSSAILCHVMLFYAISSNFMPWYAILCHVMLFYAMSHYCMPCHAILCHVMLLCAMVCYFMLWYAILCYGMLFYAMIYYFMPWYSILCHIMLFSSSILTYTHPILYVCIAPWIIRVSPIIIAILAALRYSVIRPPGRIKSKYRYKENK